MNRKYTLTVKETNKNCKKDYKVIVIEEKTSLAKITDMIVSKIINLVFVVYAIAATLCTEIFIGAYVLLISYVSVADILKCVRFENIGNTLTYIGLFFSVITSNHQNKK